MNTAHAKFLICSGLLVFAGFELFTLHLIPWFAASTLIGIGGGLVIGSGVWLWRHTTTLDDRFASVSTLFELYEDRVNDMALALEAAGIPIPHGQARRHREKRTADGRKILFPEFDNDSPDERKS